MYCNEETKTAPLWLMINPSRTWGSMEEALVGNSFPPHSEGLAIV